MRNGDEIMEFCIYFYLGHIVLKFFTGYENIDGVIEYDMYKIANHYFEGNFLFDLVVSFPHQII